LRGPRSGEERRGDDGSDEGGDEGERAWLHAILKRRQVYAIVGALR
jgi:hypothetical protein